MCGWCALQRHRNQMNSDEGSYSAIKGMAKLAYSMKN